MGAYMGSLRCTGNCPLSSLSTDNDRDGPILRSFVFLDLPVEIRLMIYEQLYVITADMAKSVLRITPHAFLANRSSSSTEWRLSKADSFATSLHRTCRQFHSEATGVIYRQNQIVFRNWNGLHLDQVQTQHIRQDLYRQLTLIVMIRTEPTLTKKSIHGAVTLLSKMTALRYILIGVRSSVHKIDSATRRDLVGCILGVLHPSVHIECCEIEEVKFWQPWSKYYVTTKDLKAWIETSREAQGNRLTQNEIESGAIMS